MSKKYYAVSGSNGVGVYDNYHMVEKNRKFLKKAKCKGFDSLEEAAASAKHSFNELCEDNFYYSGPLVLNFCLTIPQMVKIYKMDLGAEKMIKVKFENKKVSFEKIDD